MFSMFSIDGFLVVLSSVRNIYPVKDKDFYEWGFKYTDGSQEFFSYKTKKEAVKIHKEFVKAVENFWEESRQGVL